MNYHHGDRVIMPCGNLGTVSRAGRRCIYIDADEGGQDWSGPAKELRPAVPAEVGLPQCKQLSLLL